MWTLIRKKLSEKKKLHMVSHNMWERKLVKTNQTAWSSKGSLASLVQHYQSIVLKGKSLRALTVAHKVLTGRKLHAPKFFLECLFFCKEATAFSINLPFFFWIASWTFYVYMVQ